MEHLWISQVLNTSLYTCHDLITPLTRHNLTNTVALHGLRWRYKPHQSDLKFIGAAVLTAEKHLLILHSAKGATLDTGGWLNLT